MFRSWLCLCGCFNLFGSRRKLVTPKSWGQGRGGGACDCPMTSCTLTSALSGVLRFGMTMMEGYSTFPVQLHPSSQFSLPTILPLSTPSSQGKEEGKCHQRSGALGVTPCLCVTGSALSSFSSDWKIIESQPCQTGRKDITACLHLLYAGSCLHELHALPKLCDAIDPRIFCLQGNKKCNPFAQDTQSTPFLSSLSIVLSGFD